MAVSKINDVALSHLAKMNGWAVGAIVIVFDERRNNSEAHITATKNGNMTSWVIQIDSTVQEEQ